VKRDKKIIDSVASECNHETARKEKGCGIGYALAETLAREPTAWMRVPSQPLMRSPLLRSQTPTAPRRVSRFFRVWWLNELPHRADHPAYFGLATYEANPFSRRQSIH